MDEVSYRLHIWLNETKKFLDKTIIIWHLTRDETNYGIARRSLTGHNHFVSDVVIS